MARGVRNPGSSQAPEADSFCRHSSRSCFPRAASKLVTGYRTESMSSSGLRRLTEAECTVLPVESDPVGDGWVTQVGEAFVGAGHDAAHLNTALGRRGGALETAWTTSLATPRAGHVPFVVVIQPNVAVQPPTLFVNKA